MSISAISTAYETANPEIEFYVAAFVGDTTAKVVIGFTENGEEIDHAIIKNVENWRLHAAMEMLEKRHAKFIKNREDAIDEIRSKADFLSGEFGRRNSDPENQDFVWGR